MTELIKVNAPVRKPMFEGVQGENEARSIQFDITPWVEELGDGAVAATAKRSQDSQPYPVTVTKDGNIVTWKPTSTDTAYAGVGSFQLEYTVDSVLAKTCIWSTMVAPSLDPAGDPPDPYDNWLAEMREIAADAIQAAQDADESADDAQAEVYEAEAWAKGTKNGTPVTSSDAQYQNNAKYYSEESNKNAEAWAVGQRGGVDVPSTDPTYENNAKYWAEQSAENQYGAYIVKSASGDIASFSDGGDDIPMKSLNVTITPKQSGSGDPSPSNVRPITGTSTANVTVAGKNIFGGELLADTFVNIASATKDAQNKLVTYSAANVSNKVFFDKFEDGKRYTIILYGKNTNNNNDGTNLGVLYKDGTSTAIPFQTAGQDSYAVFVTREGKDVEKITGWWSSASTVLHYDLCGVFEGVLTTADFEPYTGHTTPVPLGQTVYGGTVDVVSGSGGANVYYYSFTGQEACARIDAHIFRWTMPKARSGFGEFMCNMYKPVNVQSLTQLTDKSIAMTPGGTYLYMRNDDVDTVADMKAVLQGYAQTTPLSVLYEETSETSITFDPVSVPSLLGTNNVWADCGSVEVEYRADPTLAYNELANVIVSLGGNI